MLTTKLRTAATKQQELRMQSAAHSETSHDHAFASSAINMLNGGTGST